MIKDVKELIEQQIKKSYEEILFIRAIFSVLNCASLLFLLFFFRSLYNDPDATHEDYKDWLEVAAALFAPYLSLVIQGYNYPRRRKINSLRHLLFKNKISDEDFKTICDK